MGGQTSEGLVGPGEIRCGVFLRSDPQTCATFGAVPSLLRAQYGLVSAGAFPPHATLVGSLLLTQPAATREALLLEAVQPALAGRSSFPVVNNQTGAARGPRSSTKSLTPAVGGPTHPRGGGPTQRWPSWLRA